MKRVCLGICKTRELERVEVTEITLQCINQIADYGANTKRERTASVEKERPSGPRFTMKELLFCAYEN